MEYPIVIEPDLEAGGYVVSCPTLKGCVSQGETEEEALENIKDAIKTYLESIEDLEAPQEVTHRRSQRMTKLP
ncbi:MAG: type II toxin-antitoxin system HicB family antitoxin [Nitrospira sp.]|nr:type II toxin-antitoxin system HicB family antitoxin [Nitrospira sp.]